MTLCQNNKRKFILGISGVFVIASQGLSCFGIYRLMASSSPRQAHHLRSGIICYLVFGLCSEHLIQVIGIWLNQFIDLIMMRLCKVSSMIIFTILLYHLENLLLLCIYLCLRLVQRIFINLVVYFYFYLKKSS